MTERNLEDVERDRVEGPEVSWALRDVTRAAAEVDHALARRLALSPTEHAAVGHLMDHPEGLGPVELARRLGISTGSATELVDRLQRDGHATRARHPDDRRRVVVRPTEAGVGRVLAELADLFASVDALAADLDEVEQAVVVRYLRTAAERMRGWSARGRAG